MSLPESKSELSASTNTRTVMTSHIDLHKCTNTSYCNMMHARVMCSQMYARDSFSTRFGVAHIMHIFVIYSICAYMCITCQICRNIRASICGPSDVAAAAGADTTVCVVRACGGGVYGAQAYAHVRIHFDQSHAVRA